MAGNLVKRGEKLGRMMVLFGVRQKTTQKANENDREISWWPRNDVTPLFTRCCPVSDAYGEVDTMEEGLWRKTG